MLKSGKKTNALSWFTFNCRKAGCRPQNADHFGVDLDFFLKWLGTSEVINHGYTKYLLFLTLARFTLHVARYLQLGTFVQIWFDELSLK
jgi:hypothetical protein